MQQFHDSQTSASDECFMTEHQRPQISGMKAVDVFFRINAFKDGMLAHMLRKGKLDQNSVDRIIYVELPHLNKQSFRRDSAWNGQFSAINAELLASPGLHVHIRG